MACRACAPTHPHAAGVEAVVMSAGELESEVAGKPGRLIRERYRKAADMGKVGGWRGRVRDGGGGESSPRRDHAEEGRMHAARPPHVSARANLRSLPCRQVRGRMSALVINDIDAGLGHFDNTQITVNNQVGAGAVTTCPTARHLNGWG